MTRHEIGEKANDALASGKALLRSMTKGAIEELARRAPELANSLDRPFEDAAVTFTQTLKTIDKRTRDERLELLRAYRTFIETQRVYIEGKIRSLEAI
ncbi:MAG TPA: hypothetical protein VND40_04845 [Nitrososphaerales archaeon]|nr:hypothetical protein [Nitrososphaerales archaeon]